MKTQLLEMTEDEVTRFAQNNGQPAFRGRQLFSWMHRGSAFDEMTDLPKAFRAYLQEYCTSNPVEIMEIVRSKLDGTRKLLYVLQDGNVIEGVLMWYRYGCTLCLSTQVGCRMGCAFCASTLDGRVRDLTAAEMLGEVLCANALLRGEKKNERIGNIVLMGSGEPFDNYDEVVRFLRLLREPDGIQISLRSVSLSTCGLVPEMRRFADEGLPVTLCVSLHAPNDEIRQRIMPIAKRYRIAEILDACRLYIEKTGRRVIFEYALIRNVNASPEQAVELANKLRGMQCHVNLIPLNAVKERRLEGVSEHEIRTFGAALEARGISVTRRRKMGDDIEGACGQLRRRHLNGKSAEDEMKEG